MTNIFDTLKSAVASAGLENEDLRHRPYKGHALEHELMEIDEIESMFDLEDANIGYAMAGTALLLSAGTEEDATVNYNGLGIGLESVVEKVKRAGYKAKAMAMKMVDAVVEFVKKMVNVIMNKNLMLKKFGTYIKKYRDKLSAKVFTGEKAEEKEVSIRTYTGLSTFLTECTSVTKTTIDGKISAVKNATGWQAFFTAVVGSLESLCDMNGKFTTAEAVQTILDEKTIEEKYDEKIEAFNYSETQEKGVKEAKSAILKAVADAMPHLDKDVKVQAEFRKFVDAVKKAREKVFSATGFNEDDTIIEQNMLVNKVAVVVTRIQSQYTKLFKHATNALNALLADMHKIISA